MNGLSPAVTAKLIGLACRLFAHVEINVINATMGVPWDKLVSHRIVEDFDE